MKVRGKVLWPVNAEPANISVWLPFINPAAGLALTDLPKSAAESGQNNFFNH
jgi:hypothetical protein